MKQFIAGMKMVVRELTREEMVFDLSGVEPPLANALRRIMIAEVPTMAIEKVNMWQNTSIIPDESLAHRVGLIPIKADAREFEFKKGKPVVGEDGTIDWDKEYSETETLKFKLHVKCTKKTRDAPSILMNGREEDQYYENASVFSSDLKWVPIGGQKQRLGNVRPLFDDILIAKLRPG
mmetsp:Transcript_8192/g.6110  ORF Transcript_8192/g.6110 Transcript_8192/m.6110 type:complete len:178 (+) Transcript_8192:204-737(+)